jgi:hypothetical protein
VRHGLVGKTHRKKAEADARTEVGTVVALGNGFRWGAPGVKPTPAKRGFEKRKISRTEGVSRDSTAPRVADRLPTRVVE